MKNALPYALIVLAVGLGVLVFAGGEDPQEGPDLGYEAPASGTGGGMLEAPGLETGTRPAPEKTGRPAYKPVDPATVPRGVLEVAPQDAEGNPIPSRSLHVRVEPLGLKDWTPRLGRRDAETDTWTFPKVLAGDVRVRVWGDHVVETTVEAKVRAGQTARVVVPVALGGAVTYAVEDGSGKKPEHVTVTLRTPKGGAVDAWYQVRTSRVLTQPRRAKSLRQGPEGILFGVAPGSYRLRVENDVNEWDEEDVEIVAGKTAAVTLRLSR
jgi:hypothetical protein